MAFTQEKLDEVYAIVRDSLDQYFPNGDVGTPLEVWVRQSILREIKDQVDADYLATGSKNSTSKDEGILGRSLLSRGLFGDRDILTIAAIRTGSSDADTFASLKWKEIK